MHRSLLQAERIVSEIVRLRFMLTGLVVWVLLGCVSGFGQDDIPVIDLIPSSSGIYSNAIGFGPVPAESIVTPAAAGLAFFTNSYNSLGSGLLLPFNIVVRIRQTAQPLQRYRSSLCRSGLFTKRLAVFLSMAQTLCLLCKTPQYS
jgi:hypothetical protein